MAFGQQAGPPATARQLRELLELVEAAGHSGFRDARHPLGLTQRQAGGKFTRDEAQELIDTLIEAAEGAGEAGAEAGAGAVGDDADPAAAERAPRPKRTDPKRENLARQLRKVPADLMAEELQRRGRAVIQP